MDWIDSGDIPGWARTLLAYLFRFMAYLCTILVLTYLYEGKYRAAVHEASHCGLWYCTYRLWCWFDKRIDGDV